MAPKELLALRLLMDNPRGLFGSEFVHLSQGDLGRGTVYTILERLVDKGMAREVIEPPTPEFVTPRTRYLVTGHGQKACRDYADKLGMTIQHGALAR